MFLPVLLVRDFGVAGFLVFAIPNIVGAAAMGTVLPDAQRSRAFVVQHRGACAAFSVVTILFHVFFLAWAASTFMAIPSAAILGFVPLIVCLFLLFQFDRSAVAIAWIVLLFSLTIFCDLFIRFPHASSGIALAGRLSSVNLLGLAPACVLGFLTCPYLDLTFHQARQASSPHGGAIAFRLGFGVWFPLMILFTLWYAVPMQSLNASEIDSGISRLVGAHILIQSGFTIAAHLRGLQLNWGGQSLRGTIVAIAASLVVPVVGARVPMNLPGGSGEGIYRLFMAFYGLIFPAYLCARVGTTGNARSWIILAITICAAGPFFWLGFINGKMLWLIPGVLLILAARLLIPVVPPQGAETADPTRLAHAPSTSES